MGNLLFNANSSPLVRQQMGNLLFNMSKLEALWALGEEWPF